MVFKQNKLTFVLTPSKVIVRTNLQDFYLDPRNKHWNRRLQLIRSMIMLREIRDLNELASFCASGNILWVPTSSLAKDKKLEYH